MAGEETRQSPSVESGFFYGYIVVIAALCIMVVTSGTRFAFGVFFKPMLNEFGWTRAMTSGAFSLCIIVEGLLAIVTGGLTDRFGPRIVMTLCGFLLGLGYLLMSQISTVWQMYLFYGVIIGIGMSGVVAPLLSTIAKWFAKRRVTMTGVVFSGTGMGALIAPPMANWLISIYDWRISYIILGSLVLVVVVLAAQFLKRDPAQVGLKPYGEKEEGEQELTAGAKGFSLNEAVYTRQFWLIFILELCCGVGIFAVMVHIVPHATDLGISATSAANILATVGGLMMVGRVVLGTAADKIGIKKAFIISFSLMVAALFWLVPVTEMWMLYLFAVVFGFAEGGLGSLTSPILAQLFGLSSHGLILGVIVLIFSIGAAIGPFMAGYIFDVTGGYQVAWLVSAAISIVALVSAALITPIRSERGLPP